MRVAYALSFAFFSLFIYLAPQDAAAEGFFHEEIATNAVRYEATLKTKVDPGARSAADWRRQGDRTARGGDLRGASDAYGAAALAAPDDARAWLLLARTLAAIKPKGSNERYELPEAAGSAAYIAYRRAASKRSKAEALAFLASMLARRSYWRPALDAYKASLALDSAPAVRAAYETLREQHGFRILDYSVDSDALTPRMCVQFSERLADGRIDFAKFVQVDGKDPAAVTANGKQLCIEGFAHGERYQVALRAGVPSAVSEPLAKAAEFVVYVRDRKASVRFTGRNYVLPRTGQRGIPMVSVNTKSVDVAIYRIGDRGLGSAIVAGNVHRPLNRGEINRLTRDKGEKVWSGQMPVDSPLNKDVTTAFPIGEAVPELAPGIYAMAAVPTGAKTGYWQSRATQWFVVSDLGLASIAGADGMHVFVRSLASAEPIRDAEVKLVARNNEVLATARSDAGGIVKFDPGLTRGKGGLAPAVLVATGPDADYAFLDLTKAGFDLSDRGVAGRAAPAALDAFVFTERGVYRPGAEVHVTALLRDRKAEAVTGVPLTLIFTRPDGVEHRRVTVADAGLGGRTYALALLDTAMTGTWIVAAYADPKGDRLGETRFLVEDFVPERMELSLDPEGKSVASDRAARIRLDGRYLYGAPAADLAVEGDVTLRPLTGDLEGFAGYRFGLADEKVTPVRRPLLELPRTDADGKARLAVPLPPVPETTRPLEAQVAIRLREPGGRAVTKTVALTVARTSPLIGIRPAFKDDHVGEGGTAGFDVLTLGPDGKQSAQAGLNWQLFKIDRRFQWYQQNGTWRFEPITYTERVLDGTVDTKADGPVRIEAPVQFGRYRLEVASSRPGGPASSVEFTAGWYSASAAETPDFLDIALDKPAYSPGETARVTLTPRAPGKALVAVVDQGVIDMKAVDVTGGTATVAFEVSEAWRPGAYVTAMLYRPMDVAAKRMPRRSVGVAWLGLDRSARELGLKLDLPEKTEPRRDLEVPIEVSGLKPGESAHLVVAAVDVGILNLTNHKPPAPEDWYYAQRRLGVDIRDLYGRLIDGMRAQRGTLRSGGDGGASAQKKSPPTEKPLALFSGLVTVDDSGKASVAFALPEFNGTLRVMAAAWSRDKLGHASGDVIVRNPVVMTSSLPRFLTQGDRTRLYVGIDNVEGPEGDYELAVETTGPLASLDVAGPRHLALKPGQRSAVVLPLEANGVGAATLTARLTGPGDLTLEQSYAIEVQPTSPAVSLRSVHTLVAKSGALEMNRDILSNTLPGTGKVTLSVAPGAALDVPGLLLALDRYPYGCAEQITSRALPLLYVNTIATRAGLATEADLPKRIQTAIDRVLGMQTSSGGFGLWAPVGRDMWLTAYVTDFLSRARERNYTVPNLAFDQAMDRLTNYVANTSNIEANGGALAYSLYVLARAGRANVGDLRYFADAKIDAFKSPLAKAQLAAALAMLGDTERADRAFGAALRAFEAEDAKRTSRPDYGSPLRDRAGLLTLVAESGVRKAAIPAIARRLSEARTERTYTSTQENAWLLMAAHALYAEARKLSLTLNGEAHEGAIFETYRADDLEDLAVKVVNTGDAPVTATVTVAGSPLVPPPAAAQGFTLERRTYGMDGKPVTLDTVAQNARIVVVLRATEIEAKHARVVLADHIPAGFEIENPRLGNGASPQFPWLERLSLPEHTEYRDDRYVAAFNLRNRKPGVVTVAYVIRAVTPGRYAHPPAVVEDMYRPERFARTASGTVEVTGDGR